MPGCGPGVVAVRPRDRKLDSLGYAPRISACGAGVLLLDDEPGRRAAEAVRLELTSGSVPPPVFETGSSSSRITSVSVVRKVPGVGIEPTTSWFRAKRHYQQQLPRSASSWRTSKGVFQFGEKDLNLHHLVQSQAAYR